eukprot:3209114-Prymnesium_polylepis.4
MGRGRAPRPMTRQIFGGPGPSERASGRPGGARLSTRSSGSWLVHIGQHLLPHGARVRAVQESRKHRVLDAAMTGHLLLWQRTPLQDQPTPVMTARRCPRPDGPAHVATLQKAHERALCRLTTADVSIVGTCADPLCGLGGHVARSSSISDEDHVVEQASKIQMLERFN